MTNAADSESVFRPALLLMSGRALGFVAAFAIPMVLVRIFDQSEFGTYKQLFLIFSTLFGIAQVGMAESLFYFLPAAPARCGRFVLNAMFALGAAGCVCLLALWTGERLIAEWLNNTALTGYLPLIGVYLLLMLMAAVLEIVMTARKCHLAASFTYAASDMLRAGLYLLPLIFAAQLKWLIFGAIAFASLRITATVAYLLREYGAGLRFDLVLLRRQLGYAIPFGLAVLIEVVQANYHMYAVSYHFDAATFAVYAVGVLQIPLFDFMMTSTANVMMVRMREKLEAGNHVAVLEIWRDTTRKLALIFVPMVGGLLVVAEELIVILFTDAYADSVPVFMVWTGTLLMMSVLTDAVLRVYAQTRFLVFLNLVRLALVVVLVGVFLKAFGVLGAVWVTIAATFAAKVIGLARAMSLMRTSVSKLMPWRELAAVIVITAGAATLAFSVKSALILPDLLLMLTAATVFAGAFFMLLMLFGPMSSAEKIELIDWAQRPFIQLRRSFKT